MPLSDDALTKVSLWRFDLRIAAVSIRTSCPCPGELGCHTNCPGCVLLDAVYIDRYFNRRTKVNFRRDAQLWLHHLRILGRGFWKAPHPTVRFLLRIREVARGVRILGLVGIQDCVHRRGVDVRRSKETKGNA